MGKLILPAHSCVTRGHSRELRQQGEIRLYHHAQTLVRIEQSVILRVPPVQC